MSVGNEFILKVGDKFTTDHPHFETTDGRKPALIAINPVTIGGILYNCVDLRTGDLRSLPPDANVYLRDLPGLNHTDPNRVLPNWTPKQEAMGHTLRLVLGLMDGERLQAIGNLSLYVSVEGIHDSPGVDGVESVIDNWMSDHPAAITVAVRQLATGVYDRVKNAK